ncbi:MAG: repeat-associated core domain protein [Anaerocolumna sp.]|nr:repeat-associated core domain protein [Anaerocolumna sp.]
MCPLLSIKVTKEINGNNSSNQSDTGKNTDNGNNSENGNGNSNAWKDNGAKVDQEKAGGKTKEHANKGYDKNTNANGKGYANGKNKDKSNNGKHVGWDKNDNPNTPNDPYDMINPDIFEFTGYINDINQEYTEVLMTTDSEGNYRGAYTYANGERISVEDLGQVEGVPNDPLYYLYDALGTTAAITNMNAGIIDNNRFAPFGEPLSPVAKNSRLTNSPWGYTGESHDIEAGLVYLRARYYEQGTGRFIQQDSYPYFGEIEEPLTRNLNIYGNGNPLKYTDPSGHLPILPLILKAGTNGAVDFLMQAAINFFFNNETKGNIKASIDNVNWWQVAKSAIEGFAFWKSPGGKLGKAAATAAGDVVANALHYGNSYSAEQALIDFGVGLISDLVGSELGEIISKYGAKSVARGLRMIGIPFDTIKKITGVSLDNINNVADEILNADRIGSALSKADANHRAASYLTKDQLLEGKVFIFKGNDGEIYTLLQTKGNLNNNSGIYEYILTPEGEVSHQLFIKNGTITGYANQKIR